MVGGWIRSRGVEEALNEGDDRNFEHRVVWGQMRMVVAHFVARDVGPGQGPELIRDAEGRPIVELLVTPFRQADGTRDVTDRSMVGWRVESDWNQVCFVSAYSERRNRDGTYRRFTLQETWSAVVEDLLTMWQDQEDA